MALLGINQPRPRQGKDTLDKIAQAFQIAQGIIGTGLAIPKFLQDRKEFRLEQDIAKERLAESKSQADIKEAQTFRPATPEELAKGGQFIARPESRVFPDTPLVLRTPGQDPLDVKKKTLEITKLEQALGQKNLNDVDKSMLRMIERDFTLPAPGQQGTVKFTVGGNELNLVPRPKDVDPGETEDREDKLRKEFLKESGEFIKQTSSMARVNASAKDPSAAGDLALIFNFMKVLDPGSVVRESEFANAQNTGSIPNRIWAQYNRVLRGERLSPQQRADFFNRAKKLYAGALNLHSSREKFYRDLANERDINVQRVLPDLTLKGFSIGPSASEAEGF